MRAHDPAEVSTAVVSVIIPTLNEEATLSKTLRSTQGDSATEVIIVDGGSGDWTREIASGFGAQILTAKPGRGQQMRMGAEAACGEFLLFLHADTTLPNCFAQIVRATMDDPAVAMGAFDLRVESAMRRFRLMEKLVRWRSRWLHLPYGDQALFVRRSVLDAIGGVPPISLMEDCEMVRRVRRIGRIAVVSECVTTSPRRWSKHGFLRTCALNLACVAAYRLGCPPGHLHHWREGKHHTARSSESAPQIASTRR